MKKTMTILPISDIHSDALLIDQLIDKYANTHIDFVCIAGDVLESNSDPNLTLLENIQSAFNADVVFISGNHDYWHYAQKIKELRLDRVHYLFNEVKTIKDVVFYGSPHSTPFCNWNYMMNDNMIWQCLKSTMTENIDVALFHQPPYGYGDVVTQRRVSNEKLGSHSILKAINAFKPRYVFYGHIHSGNHVAQSINEITIGKNVACLNEFYDVDIQHIETFDINIETRDQ
jgi:Icc-related predicted phosphoesterase